MIIRHFPQQCSAQVSQVLYHLSQWQCVSIDLDLPVTVTSGIITCLAGNLELNLHLPLLLGGGHTQCICLKKFFKIVLGRDVPPTLT